ncbi:hypothetical protein F5Y00DRAFT_154130 [Daldinia vernicosa]|uniref:uncharacterized protein n=1 Tax=Daldinia vernicosa TaxID=114800 RepID=UPI0020074CAD|nr:uncharacterized protein F5Y00DRAFT_154130 [Daldinia vernicosa]KAI0852745.1 hypothetical protein F5Y00DRAFT_154130 [Daldinia vernicosa]
MHSPISIRFAQLFILQHQRLPFSSFYYLATQDYYRPPTTRLFCTTTSLKMPSYIVTLKENATPEEVAAAKKHAQDQGGKIGHEYSLIKAFSVTFPNDAVNTLESHEHVKAVELDQEVRTQ